MELYAELKLRDGQRKRFTLSCEHNLKGIILGLNQLKAEVSVTLTELVVQEKKTNNLSQQANQVSDEEDEDESDDDEGKTINSNTEAEPPLKKKKK